MTWISTLKNFLNQNIIARLFLYLAALVEPVTFSYMFFNIAYLNSPYFINPYYVLGISFYACVLLWWSSEDGSSQWVISCLLGFVNGLIILIFFFIALIGGAIHLPLLLLFMLFPFACPLALWTESPLIVLIGCILVTAVIGFWIKQNRFQKI